VGFLPIKVSISDVLVGLSAAVEPAVASPLFDVF
jgi:hypothetical protein